MSESVREAAAQALSEVEALSAALLPVPAEAVVPLAEAAPDRAAEIRQRMAEIDLTNTQSIISFGSGAQAELQTISQDMLAGVKNKDVGPAGDALREIVTTLRGFSSEELDLTRERSWWDKLTGQAAPIAKFVARYEEVQGQIDKITENLLQHEHTLLKDIRALDMLYDRTLKFYDELAVYIAAGVAKLEEADKTLIPAREAEMNAAPEEDKVRIAQSLRDLRAARDDLERRVHDLRLTRQVTMQSLPSIRLVQENDKSLVTKINSTLVNTVPLWETQLAQAVTIQRSKDAAEAVREANDLTNELLKSNADNLREANSIVREEMERGVFDIESVRAANETLIATIEDSLRIADEGKARRAAAETELQKLEGDLRDSLAAARARPQPSAAPPT
ncbi:toxic anion resistance protein [Rhodobacteraceae bacterium HSP-20]|uniref:Toxic anion resistance protein n=1 Tax=Paragemmobacter amnigenus TaxID=2852097 RepID=A0ABS6J0Z7_9RHOB|nr:toxic anion resistance protein [Rhodobacter amnigenus]MBU9697415.1 toxic anion resistance protein [Rhodobacter amnigenus]MBV4388642.1 toxic anion resistance protein [Rhodobacter amnigenus]